MPSWQLVQGVRIEPRNPALRSTPIPTENPVIRASPTAAKRRVEVWMPRHKSAALSDDSDRIERPMRWIVQEWLAPHLQDVIAGEIPADIDVPQAIPDRQKMHVEITLPQYQAVRLATSRLRTSRNRLLYAWLKPCLAEVTASDA